MALMSMVRNDRPASLKVGMYRNPALLRLAKDCPRCMGCGRRNDGTVVSAHSNSYRDGKARSLKAHDYRIAFLCHGCHHEIDQGSKMSREERTTFWEDAHRETIGWLFESGHLVVVK